MRIFITTTEPNVGDRGQRAVAYATGLKRRGHEVLLAHGESDDVMRAAQSGDVPVSAIATPSGAVSRGIRVRDLHRAFRDFRPDVVHVDSTAAALASGVASPRTPVIMTIERLDCSRRRALFAIRASRARLHTTSQILASGLLAQGITSRMQVILPGVDVADLRHEAREGPAMPIPDRRPLVVCANPNPIANGVIGVIEAWQQVVAARPEALLLIVGAGADRGMLRERAGELGIFHEVAFVDGDRRAAPYLAAADLVIVPAEQETMTFSALRAMALERPVVATAVRGMEELMRHGDTGWLVPPGDTSALGHGVLAALANNSERARRAVQGLALVERDYTAEAMVDRLVDECRAAIAHRAPASHGLPTVMADDSVPPPSLERSGATTAQ